MNPLGRIFGPAFSAMLGVTQPVQDTGPRRYTAPIVAPIPRDKPPIPGTAAATATTVDSANAAPVETAQASATTVAAKGDRLSAAPPVPDKAVEATVTNTTAAAETVVAMPAQGTERDLGAVVVPVPRRRPDLNLGSVIIPLPRPKPDRPVVSVSAPAQRESRIASLRPPERPLDRPLDDAACTAALTAAGVQFEVLPSNENGSCGLTQPLKVAAVAKEGLRFSPAPVMGCSATRAVLAWLEKTVQPAASAELSTPITGIQVADSYSCRGRNNVPGAKLSEHAAGNAIDISAFQIGTGKQARWVQVSARANAGDPEAKFLATVRQGACTYFTTVLGPGQPDHDTHFHLDIGKHGRSGTYRICQ